MNKISTLLFLCLMAFTTASAQFSSAPAFPGAEGYGRFTTGGRGGAVYHVTTLEDNVDSPTEGMLRYYISKKNGPRTIVFDVAGTIELKAALKISEGKGDISILGQTAPGQGICLKCYPLVINADNVIIRFIRCRLGDFGDDADAMSASHHDDAVCKNIIIDHCSMSWCTDEVGSFYGNENFTLQWCLLSESLKLNSAKGSDTHGFGGIWGGKKASFHHNLLAHNDSRMIRFDHGYVSTLTGPVDYTNNVVYNWGGNSSYGGENNEGAESKTFNMINNYYKPGPSTSSSAKTRLLNPSTTCGNCTGVDVPGKFYISGNYMYGSATVTADNTCSSAIKMDGGSPITYADWKANYVSSSKFISDETAFNYNTISLQTAEKAYDKVLAYAGASLSYDDVDTRVINDAKNGTGKIIDYTSSLISWPTLEGTAQKDTDGDGMPDEWEIAHGLDASYANANGYDLDEKGYYTNLEVYANSLVEDIVKAERADADETFEEYYPDTSKAKEAPVLYSYSVDAATVDGFSTISYLDGAAIALTGNSAKSYGGAKKLVVNGNEYTTIKLSNGAQNTFKAPEGKAVSSVTVYSYINKASGNRTSYWKEFAGDTIRTDDARYMEMADWNDGASYLSTPDTYTYSFSAPVSSFTFSQTGEQVCFVLEITYGDATGIDSISAPKATVARVRKYIQNGRLVIETPNGTFTTMGARLK